MAKSPRLTRLWRTFRERGPQSLPVFSKRLTSSFRSIIARKTNQHDLDMSQSEDAVYQEPHEGNSRFTLDADIVCQTPDAGEDFEAGDDVETGDDPEAGCRIDTKELASEISVPSFSAQEKRKRSGEHDDSAPKSARHGLEDKGSAPPDISRKPSTKKVQEIIKWVNQQPGTPHLSGHDAEQAPEFPPSRSDSGDLGIPDDRFDMTEEGEPQAMEFIPSCSSSPKRFHPPRPPHARAGSQDPKTRVIRESQQDQFASVSRRGTFESQHRGIYAFRIPSNPSIADQFSFSRRDSEATVGTTISGTVSDGTSIKRWSASTISTTLTLAASSEMLHAQFKRLRSDSRTNSSRSKPTPSVRSPPHSSMTNAPGPKAPSPLPRDPTPRPDKSHPPIPALPASIHPSHELPGYMQLPLPPQIVLQAGTLAQERRGKHGNPGLPIAASGGDCAEQPSLFVPCETDNDILSVINEHASDAGSAKLDSSCPSVDLRLATHEFTTEGGGADGQLTDPQPSEIASVFSRETSPQDSSTSVTTLGDLMESDQTAQEISDDEDTMSDVTDHTDLSLIEAFDASPTPFDPILLSVLISLKEEVVDRIRRRLQTMMLQSAGTQQRPMQDNNSSHSSSELPSGNADTISVSTSLPTRRKRALDEDEGSNPGRRGGDDGEKRKRKDSTSRTQLEKRLRKFACPFYKKYPDSESLQKACHGPGWSSVHRVKEHIYRRHQRPTVQCTRCLVSFDNDETLAEHLRAENRCENKTPSPDEEIIYITQSQERELRKKKKNVPEEDRWFNCFRIIFPNTPDDRLPSPYHDYYQDQLPDSAIVSEFRAFLEQQLPSRITADVNNHLRVRPEGVSIQGDMTGVIRDTIREVMDEFSGILASPAANRDANGHMGLTDWPLRGTAMRVGGPSIPLANTHTIHTPLAMVSGPFPTSRRAGGPSSMLSSPPANTHPIHPSPPRVPPPLPTTWNFGPVFASPAASTLDFGLHPQHAATDGAPSAQVLPGSWPGPGDWDGFDSGFSLFGTDFEGGRFHHDNGTSA